MSDHDHFKQGRRSSTKHRIFLLFVLLCAFSLTACGKKASRLAPPDTVVDDTFPQAYPNPDSDPKPTLDPQANPTLRIAPTVPAAVAAPVH